MSKWTTFCRDVEGWLRSRIGDFHVSYCNGVIGFYAFCLHDCDGVVCVGRYDYSVADWLSEFPPAGDVGLRALGHLCNHGYCFRCGKSNVFIL